jgi:4-hydroxythreonine-4-phosphate dehydrogenase
LKLNPAFWKRIVVVGDLSLLQSLNKRYRLGLSITEMKNFGEARDSGSVAVLDVSTSGKERFLEGRCSAKSGEAAVGYLKEAVSLIGSGLAGALVTAPINKKSIHLAGYDYPGHTEMLAEWTGTRRYAMMFVSDRMKVALATIHLPLSAVKRAIRRSLIEEKIDLVHNTLTALGMERPNIAVSGLNPHAGEGEIFGSEEKEIIRPAIRNMVRKGIRVSGPYPADTLFIPSRLKQFDAFLAMYHDQGLIPIKALSFNRMVNVTLGLPFIRTSVDHGTAFDIAGKNRADPSSMTAAIRLALDWSGKMKRRGVGT